MAEERSLKAQSPESVSEALLPSDKLADVKRIALELLAGAAAVPGNLDGPELQPQAQEKPAYLSGADPQDIEEILREDATDEAAAEAEPAPAEPEEREAFVEELPLGDFKLRPGHGGEPV